MEVIPIGATGATLCSGIGCPELAAPWIDWRLGCEMAAFPRAVMMQRHGLIAEDDPARNQGDPVLIRDMATITADTWARNGLPLPDVIVAGTPCQAFSISGARAGLADARGNLTLKYVEILHDIQDASPARPFLSIWENVPGVLSMADNAFGCLLGGIVGHDDAILSPLGFGWPGVGMVAGPRARAAWRVLDAQHFGVPQRRARVFLVADFGGGSDPAQILFERQGL